MCAGDIASVLSLVGDYALISSLEITVMRMILALGRHLEITNSCYLLVVLADN